MRAHYRRTLLDDSAGNGVGRAKLQILEALLRLAAGRVSSWPDRSPAHRHNLPDAHRTHRPEATGTSS